MLISHRTNTQEILAKRTDSLQSQYVGHTFVGPHFHPQGQRSLCSPHCATHRDQQIDAFQTVKHVSAFSF